MSRSKWRVFSAAIAATALLAACGGGGATPTADPSGSVSEGSETGETTPGGETTPADETEDSTGDGSDAPPAGGSTVTLVTHDSFALPDDVWADFKESSGYTVEVVAPGDGGDLVNQLILTKNSPLGDVVYGIDNTFASRAVNEGVLAKYEPSAAVPGFETLGGHVTAIDQGDVCLNVDHEWFAENGVHEPVGFEHLLEPEYKDLVVLTNPSTSSPGHAFLLATIAHFGEDGWQNYWKDLLANGARIANGWSDAYYSDFSGSDGKGPRPIVLSYSSSPSAEIREDGTARTGSVMSTCFRQIEYAAVIEGAANPDGAKALIDFLLSDTVQNHLPSSMYVYPVSPTAVLPKEWTDWAELSDNPLTIDPATITENRDRWLKEWLDLIG